MGAAAGERQAASMDCRPKIGPAALTDSARLERILQLYGQDPDIVWAVERLEPRQCRIRRRDDAIRTALAHFSGPPTAAARALAAALAAYFCSGWPAERHLPVLPDASDRHRDLHSILRLNGGKPMGYRRILDISK